MRSVLGLVTVFAAMGCWGQSPAPRPAEGARDLFFFGSAPKDDLPPIAPAPAAANAKRSPATRPEAVSTAPAAMGALHLGLRYTLLLVRSPGDRGQPADPDHNFRKGDCVAINLEANRSGYLYVLARQSSGDWIPLFPTPELSDQSNRIDPGQVIRTPRRTCFEIEDPPGTETLFVVLSRNPRDINQLAEGIKGPGEKSGRVQVASAARINSAVDQIAEHFGTRDLPFKEIVKPAEAQKAAGPANRTDPEHAVYVVTGSNKPASTLVTKVEIRHR